MRVLFSALCLVSISLFAEEDIRDADRGQFSLKLLKEGNLRYANGKPLHPQQEKEIRTTLKDEQNPFAAIISCSDSRSPPELLFDQGLGDLFVVRVAGNVAGELELGSLDFAANRLGVPLIVVLGHQNCGAMKAALNGATKEFDIEAIDPFVNPLIGQIAKDSKDPLKDLTLANVKNQVEALKNQPILQKLIEKKELLIVGGYYSFDTGLVEVLP